MAHQRWLVVVADDFGIGPATSAGILDLAGKGAVTASVLLVNSPHADDAVRHWRRAAAPMELGWHANLTLDRPTAPPQRVTSLLQADGTFWPLAAFVKRLFLGRIRPAEIEIELEAQLRRFCDLVGGPPPLINAHQHVNLFAPVGYILLDLLQRRRLTPYLRRVREPWTTLRKIPGARGKRAFLSSLGRPLARKQNQLGFPGNDWLAGISNPAQAQHAGFFGRWLRHTPGKVVELMCHPGEYDTTLLGRDGTAHDGLVQRRVDELKLLREPSFIENARAAGFHLVSTTELCHAVLERR